MFDRSETTEPRRYAPKTRRVGGGDSGGGGRGGRSKGWRETPAEIERQTTFLKMAGKRFVTIVLSRVLQRSEVKETSARKYLENDVYRGSSWLRM